LLTQAEKLEQDSALVEKVVQAMRKAVQNPMTDTLLNQGFVMAQAAVHAVLDNEKCAICGHHLQAPTMCDMCAAGAE
jgi:hypothetical protein